METRELICIGCPLGCALKVEIDQGKASEYYRKYLQKRGRLR